MPFMEKAERVRCVVLGDDSVGKTSMLMGYATHRYPTQHVPAVFDNHAGSLKIGGRELHLELIDTMEQEANAELRHGLYPGADIFVVCFSVIQPSSLRHAEDVWLPEIRRLHPDTPVLLVGTQADLREASTIVRMLRERGEEPVSSSRGMAVAKQLGAACYLECSPGVEKKLRRIINSALASLLKWRYLEDSQLCTIL